MKTFLLSAVVVFTGACSSGHKETHAVGSIAYHASPTGCEVTGNDSGALKVHADHYKSSDGKGVVFEAVKAGKAVIKCGDEEQTTISVREAARIELHRTDGDSKPASSSDLYAPGFCIQAFDKGGKKLELGRFTEGVEFTTSDHLSAIVDHGMGGAGPGEACLSQQGVKKPGTASIAVTWKGMAAKASLEITDKK